MLQSVRIQGQNISSGLGQPVASPDHNSKKGTTHVVWLIHTPFAKNVAHMTHTYSA
jgi:hypothetical protein